jgi:hypothetical protein
MVQGGAAHAVMFSKRPALPHIEREHPLMTYRTAPPKHPNPQYIHPRFRLYLDFGGREYQHAAKRSYHSRQ